MALPAMGIGVTVQSEEGEVAKTLSFCVAGASS